MAKKSGIIEEIIAKNGKALYKSGDYVNAGDILITGMIPDKNGENIRYIHSFGQVYGRMVYVVTINEPKKEIILKETGLYIPGFFIRINQFKIDTGNMMCQFEDYQVQRKNMITFRKPILFQLDFLRYNQVQVEVVVIYLFASCHRYWNSLPPRESRKHP